MGEWGVGVESECQMQSLRDEQITVLNVSTGRRFTTATQHIQNYCDYKNVKNAYQVLPHSEDTAYPHSQEEENEREREHGSMWYMIVNEKLGQPE
jgi:hypothetical protein